MFFVHIYNSCTGNGDSLYLLIKTGNALKQRILSQITTNTRKKYEGEILKHGQKGWWRPNGGCFLNYRNKLVDGNFILGFGATPFVSIFAVLSSLAALFALFPE